MRHPLACGLALLLLVVATSALGQDLPPPEPPPVPDGEEPTQVAPTGDAAAPAAEAVPDDPAPTAPAAPIDTSRRTTRAATLSLRSFTPETTMAAVSKGLEALGGYMQSSSNGQLEMRIPLAAFDKALVAVREAGEVVDEQVTSEDVTLELVTLASRIAEIDESRVRILKMLASAPNVSDSLKIEQELGSLTSELEGYQGRVRFLEARLEYAPLVVSVSMKARPIVEKPQKPNPFPWVSDYGLERLVY